MEATILDMIKSNIALLTKKQQLRLVADVLEKVDGCENRVSEIRGRAEILAEYDFHAMADEMAKNFKYKKVPKHQVAS